MTTQIQDPCPRCGAETQGAPRNCPTCGHVLEYEQTITQPTPTRLGEARCVNCHRMRTTMVADDGTPARPVLCKDCQRRVLPVGVEVAVR